MNNIIDDDDIILTKNNNVWNYIIDSKQWTKLKKSIFDDNQYIIPTSQKNLDIKKNDVVMIYIKKKPKSGYIAILNVSKYFKNTDNIKIFNDKNINKYLISFEVIIDFHLLTYDITETIIKKYYSIIMFNQKYLYGEFVLHKLPFKFSVELLKLLLVKSNEEIPTNTKIISDKLTDSIVCNNDDDNKQLSIIHNIPVMVILTDKLLDMFDSFDSDIQKIMLLIDNMKYSKKCDIINNNINGDIKLIELLNKHKNNLTIEEYDCDDYEEDETLIHKYINSIAYLNENQKETEYINIYRIINEDDYENCFIITYQYEEKNMYL
jgi:hypothetical protein